MTFYSDPSPTSPAAALDPALLAARREQVAAQEAAWRDQFVTRQVAQRTAEQAAWREYNERWQVFTRLHELSRGHAREAWRHRISRPLAPHALAFLFRQPAGNGRAPGVLIQAATRVWWAGPQATEPLRLLVGLIQQAEARDPGVPWDLRTEIANRSDPHMADDATYCGLGMSLLDTDTGTFEQACRTANDLWDIPGTILLVAGHSPKVEDQRVIVADRRGRADLGQLTIASHRALCHHNGASREAYKEENLETLYGQYGYTQLLRGMWRLDQALRVADEARRALQQVTAQTPRRTEPSHGSRRVPPGVAPAPRPSSHDQHRRRSW